MDAATAGGLVSTLGFPIAAFLLFTFAFTTQRIVAGPTYREALAARDAAHASAMAQANNETRDARAQRDLLLQVALKNANAAEGAAALALQVRQREGT